MDTTDQLGLELSTQRVVLIGITPGIVANGSSIRPSHVITVVGEHRVQLGAIGDEDTLESVLLYREITYVLGTKRRTIVILIVHQDGNNDLLDQNVHVFLQIKPHP